MTTYIVRVKTGSRSANQPASLLAGVKAESSEDSDGSEVSNRHWQSLAKFRQLNEMTKNHSQHIKALSGGPLWSNFMAASPV